MLVLEPELDEHEYLRQVELLAGDVVRTAAEEGWLTHGADAAEAPALHRAVNELARAPAHWHFDGDGCLDPDRDLRRWMRASRRRRPRRGLGTVAHLGRPGPAVHRGHHTRPGHHRGPAGQLVPWPGPASRTATTGSDRCGARPLARADHVLTQPCHQGRPRRTLHRPDPAPSAENASECPDLRSKQARQNMLGAAHMCRCQCAVGYRGLVTLRR